MPRPTKTTKPAKSLEQRLWDAADALRGNQEPSEYKHVVLGLVFLKYISDRFDERRIALVDELTADDIVGDDQARFLEDRDEYTRANVFWVPKNARWEYLQSQAKTAQSASSSMPRWMPSNMRTRRSKVCYRATMGAKGWTRDVWGNWSI